jgi:Secretion system C-terminal sorting domain
MYIADGSNHRVRRVSSILGYGQVCLGMTTTLSAIVSGGTWTSSNPAVISIGSSTGIATGIAVGTVTISYSSSVGTNTVSMSVITPPNSLITGDSMVCAGHNINLTDTGAGGIWSCTNGHATVSGGIVTAVSAGVDTILYTLTNFCGTNSASSVVTINPLPDPGMIICDSALCAIGATTGISESIIGGVWSLSNGVVSLTGSVATAVAVGTDTIKYTVANAWCAASATRTITVALPPATAGAITGPDTVCIGGSITVSDVAGGGVWSGTSEVSVATDGVVTGLTAGAAYIFYTIFNACGIIATERDVYVNDSYPCIPLTVVGPTDGEDHLEIFPNPAEKHITVRFSTRDHSEVYLAISDMLGHTIGNFVLEANTPTDINLHLPEGVYVVSTCNADIKYFSRLVISR